MIKHRGKPMYASGDLGEEDDTADESTFHEQQTEKHNSRSPGAVQTQLNSRPNNLQIVSPERIVPKSRKTTAKKRRKPADPIHREMRFIKEVLRMQNSTDFMIPRLPFSRLVRELIHERSTVINRITASAIDALQTASEMYATQRLQDAYLLAIHRGRSTLTVKDMQLLAYLKSSNNL